MLEIIFIKSPTNEAHKLAYFFGDKVSLETTLANTLISEGYAIAGDSTADIWADMPQKDFFAGEGITKVVHILPIAKKDHYAGLEEHEWEQVKRYIFSKYSAYI